jgi:2-haloacid dehalogenase
MRPIDFSAFDALTFDCYGTLIDWEAGILAALRPVIQADVGDDALLEAFARYEAALEAGPYLPYKDVLAGCLDKLGEELAFTPTAAERDTFGHSVKDWPVFPDSPEALAKLKQRFKLGVITNCDDDLFAASNARLKVEFDWIVTAEQARGYKPRTENFEFAFARIDVPRERILHVAQSLFHDHVPAQALGLTSAWIDRRHEVGGSGATAPVSPEVRYDFRFTSLGGLADAHRAGG